MIFSARTCPSISALCLMTALGAGDFTLALACKGAPPGGPIEISVEPAAISQGGLALVTVLTREPSAVTEARFLGRCIHLAPAPSGPGALAIIGAGLDCPPGQHLLTVHWMGPEGPEIAVCTVEVRQRHFPEEHLTVPRKMVEFPPGVLRRIREEQRAVALACSSESQPRRWETPFVWPVEGAVLSPFGLRRYFNGQPRNPHSGVDLRAGHGTKIRAANHGRVVLVRDCYLSGMTVIIDHGYGLHTLYAHLSACIIKEEETVSRGQVIGMAGSTGRATGPHLHWGVSLQGTRLDPEKMMDLLGPGGIDERAADGPGPALPSGRSVPGAGV